MQDPESIQEILDEKSEKLKKNGGARPGAGMPKGYVTKKKRTAMEAKKRFIERVHQHVDELFDAQLDLAKGEKVAMVKIKERGDDGKVKKIYHDVVTDPDTIRQMMDNEEGTRDAYEQLDDEDHFYYFTIKPANNQAIEGMLNRAYGKAQEKIEVEGGFFKQDLLKIEIVKPEIEIENGSTETADDSEIEHEAEPGSQPS